MDFSKSKNSYDSLTCFRVVYFRFILFEWRGNTSIVLNIKAKNTTSNTFPSAVSRANGRMDGRISSRHYSLKSRHSATWWTEFYTPSEKRQI